ncbi:MAG: radical SAM protein [Candidatus Neomarinimicrobiota bacterium]
MEKEIKIAAASKIGYHQKKIRDYLNDDNIYPASLELDISSRCNLKCSDCPSSRGSKYWNLEIKFIERLFEMLSGKTKGLLMTGGEPTMAESFPEVIKIARRYKFEDIAVVTNGSFLDTAKVYRALLNYASTIRISIYDWNSDLCGGIDKTLRKIEHMRERIEKSGSKLQIGISVLTSNEMAESIFSMGELIQSAGAHWIYFHPTCIKWDRGSPEQVKQSNVLDNIIEYQNRNGSNVFILEERYKEYGLTFRKYHAANFLLVVGADGKNYLGAEVKYQPSHVLWDLKNNWRDDFLWHPDRLRHIASVNDQNYLAIRSRHRGVLYNNFIESFIADKIQDGFSPPHLEFKFPHIL